MEIWGSGAAGVCFEGIPKCCWEVSYGVSYEVSYLSWNADASERVSMEINHKDHRLGSLHTASFHSLPLPASLHLQSLLPSPSLPTWWEFQPFWTGWELGGNLPVAPSSKRNLKCGEGKGMAPRAASTMHSCAHFHDLPSVCREVEKIMSNRIPVRKSPGTTLIKFIVGEGENHKDMVHLGKTNAHC